MLGSSPLLEVKHVTKRFGGIAAVDDATFHVAAGTVCGLVGPNGAGKTTLINLISGFESLTSGRVLFEGHPVTRMPPHLRSRRGLVRTFQQARVFQSMSVFECLVAAGHVAAGHHRRFGAAGLVRLPGGRGVKERAHELVRDWELDAWSDTAAALLPYGIKKKLGLVLALMRHPKMLLLDEPAAGLNSAETDQLMQDLRRLSASGLTMLVVEHNMSLIMSISDRILVLDHGETIAYAEPQVVVRDPRVIEAYLG